MAIADYSGMGQSIKIFICATTILTLAFLISGCGRFEVESHMSLENLDLSSNETSKLNGTWVHDCGYNLASAARSQRSILIAEDRLITTDRIFAEQNSCATLKQEQKFYRKFRAKTLPGNLYEIDSELINVEITALSDLAVQEFNSRAYCGSTNWAKDQMKDVTNSSCDRQLKNYYTTLLQRNNELFFADVTSGNGLTIEARPTIIDMSTPFLNLGSNE